MNRQTILQLAQWGGWSGIILLNTAIFFSPAPAHILWSWVMFCGLVSMIARMRFLHTPLDIPILLYIAALTIAHLLSPQMLSSSLAKPPLHFLFFAVTQLGLPSTRRREILWGFVFVALAAASWGTFRYGIGAIDRLSVSGGGYTALSTLLLFALGVVWGWMVTLPRWRLWLTLLNIPLLGGLVLTFCRAQWLAAVVQSMILALRRYRKLAFAGVGLALLVIAALILIPRQGVEVVRFQISDPEFISSRDIIYYGAAEAFPLMSASGFGPETFQQAFPLKSRFVTPVKSVGGWHNDIIQAFLEGGVIALLAYLWMVIAAIRHVFRRARDDDDPWVVGGRWGIAVATAGVALSAMLCNVITVPLVIMAQAVLWGLAVGKIDIHVQAPDSRGSL